MESSSDIQTFREIIRKASAALDSEKFRAQNHLTPAERMQLMFELCEQECQKMFAEERAQYPDESDELLWRRVRDRVLEQQDLTDKVRADLKEWIRRKENESTPI